MRRLHRAKTVRGRDPIGALPLAISLLLLAPGCAVDAPSPSEPPVAALDAPAQAAADGGQTIVVDDAAELVAAMSPEHAGRRILVRAGSYLVSQTLVVPDGATLEGEGVMLLDETGLPAGFAAGTRTSIAMTANVPGDVLTLGDGVTVRRLALEDLPGRSGNAIGIVSRHDRDRVSATIVETEIVNPNPHGVAPQGPTGCGLAVLTLNPNLGADPLPHVGASITARVTRTLIRSPAMGVGCGLFAFNFAPSASISVDVSRSVIGGGVIASGGVSRPDAVNDSRTVLASHHNLYRDDTADPCAAGRLGWNLQGGSGTPIPLPNPGAARNALRLHSVSDRIEGFTMGVLATGGRRFFGAPTAGPVTDNSVDLELLGTTISTPACGEAAFVADLRLAGALVTDGAIVPGDGNTLRAVLRGVTGSGSRSNDYADVLGPAGAQPPSLQGAGNRLSIVGSPEAFARTNHAIAPAPGATFFTGGAR